MAYSDFILKEINVDNLSEYGIKLSNYIHRLSIVTQVIKGFQPPKELEKEFIKYATKRIKQFDYSVLFSVEYYRQYPDMSMYNTVLVCKETKKREEIINKGRNVNVIKFDTHLSFCSYNALGRYLQKEFAYKMISMMYPEMYKYSLTTEKVTFPTQTMKLTSLFNNRNSLVDFLKIVKREKKLKSTEFKSNITTHIVDSGSNVLYFGVKDIPEDSKIDSFYIYCEHLKNKDFEANLNEFVKYAHHYSNLGCYNNAIPKE